MATCLSCGKEYERSVGDLGSYCPACFESQESQESLSDELAEELAEKPMPTAAPPFPGLTVLLIATNVLVFVAMASRIGPLDLPHLGNSQFLIRWGAQFGPLFVAGEWWRLFTSMFLHAGFNHLLVNMVTLWVVGKKLEPVGRVQFLLVYILSGAGGSIASMLWNPEVVSVGASGAISGLIGALVSPRRINKGSLGMLALFVALIVLPGAMKERVDYMGHFGGIVTGIVMGIALHRPRQSDAPKRSMRLAVTSLAVTLALATGAILAKSRNEYFRQGAQASAAEPQASAADHIRRGTELYQKADLDGAVSEYREAVRLKPDFAEGYYHLGVALQGKGDRAAAIAAYRKALALNSKFPEALANLGSALASKGEIDEAVGAYREALKLKPDNAQIHASLGVALRRKGDEEAAGREFQEARRLDPRLGLPPPRGTLPIADDFAGECGWPSGEMETFSYGCERGAYRMHVKKAGPVHVMRGFALEVQAVSAEVDAGVDTGAGAEPGRALLGIGCLADGSHGYVAMVKTDGAWSIVRFNQSLTPLAGENKGGNIPKLGRTNRVGIVCNGGSEKATVVSFFVNGQKVGSVADEQGYGWFNGFALYADTFPGVVVFQRFVARQPTN